MPSIIDIIAKVEKEAEDIRKHGAKAAADIVAQAEYDSARRIAETEQRAADLFVQKREASIRAGRRLSGDIYNVRKKEAEGICDLASTRIPKAVHYLIERLNA